jgi:hypothetical protein
VISLLGELVKNIKARRHATFASRFNSVGGVIAVFLGAESRSPLSDDSPTENWFAWSFELEDRVTLVLALGLGAWPGE